MNGAEQARLTVFISGRGSNLKALIAACEAGTIAAKIVQVISDKADAGGLIAAREAGITCHVLTIASKSEKAAFEQACLSLIRDSETDLVVLAGFMRILSADFIKSCSAPLINIHPSLLPDYPGLHTHARVLEAGERQHGCTVHYVSAEVDGGPVIDQSRLDVLDHDDETSLAARVLVLEHELLIRVTARIASERLKHRRTLSGVKERSGGAAWVLSFIRRLLRRVGFPLIFFLCLLLIIYTALPWLIRVESFADVLKNEINSGYQHNFSYEEVSLRTFPRPELVMMSPRLVSRGQQGEGRVSVEGLELTVDLISLYLSQRPRFRLIQPDIDVQLTSPLDREQLGEEVHSYLAGLFEGRRSVPFSELVIEQGVITYANSSGGVFEYIYNINGRLDYDSGVASLEGAGLWRAESMTLSTQIMLDDREPRTLDPPALFTSLSLRVPFGAFTYKGRVILSPYRLLQGALSLTINDLTRYERWRERMNYDRLTSFHLKSFTLDGNLSVQGDDIHVSEANLRLNDLPGEGSLAYDRGKIQANLHFPLMTSDLLFSPFISDAFKPDNFEASLFRSEAWHNLNMDLRISAGQLNIKGVVFAPLAFTMTAAEGRADFILGKAGLGGGSLGARLSVLDDGVGVRTELTLSGKEVDSLVIAQMLGQEWPLSGTFDLIGKMTARGYNRQTYLANLQGELNLKSLEEVMVRYDLARWLNELTSERLSLVSLPSGVTRLKAKPLILTLGDYQADLKDWSFENSQVRVGINGRINFDSGMDIALDLAGQDEKKKDVRLQFGGTLSRPRLILPVR